MKNKHLRNLFVCNSVYQTLVAMWIQYACCGDTPADMIVSDHMNGGEALCKRLQKSSMFENVYYVKNVGFAKFQKRIHRLERIEASLMPNRFLKRFVHLEHRYSSIYLANVDYFSQLLFDAASHKNPEVKLFIYEDGLFTYSRLYEKDYAGTYIPVTQPLKKFLHRHIYRKRTIYGHVAGMLLFNPDNLNWTPPFPVQALLKIDRTDEQFRTLCNLVFDYSQSVDQYDRKYIFMEESFYAEGAALNDLEVIQQLAQRVGKDNIMVKIHPRNPENRFASLGFKTNKNTSIPWEVILMNLGDISDKKLITVSSSSVLNPILIFGLPVKAYSIYHCVDHEHCNSRLLSGEMWEIAQKMFHKYSDMVTICDSIDDIP